MSASAVGVVVSLVIPVHNEAALLPRLRTVKANASMRKFDRHGDWHYFRMVPRLTAGLFFPNRLSRDLVQEYWYNDRQPSSPPRDGVE